ncbi:alpha/beta hydrolase family protein [Hymenobacter volaticus]|uniref:Alpha/beta fold hydrolase n=1 Tax=Hymenobacter volaticus TaxID=2932254 RepID=A0ABY4G2V2_9BACT|nr:alpha/beta fold hydrolase [Hymenobacter volaticus]UOQ65148.1 alpha/beta fold hydrolase [Hymenobacter volaticus]
MKKLVSRSLWNWVVLMLLSLIICTEAQAQAPTAKRYSLEGQWKGALTVPGGSLPMMITVTELADGNRFAVLDVPMQRVNREPMTVTPRGDTLTFEAEQAGCRFVGRRSADGQQLLGVWQQTGYSAPLTLLFIPPATTAAPKIFKFPPPYRVEEVKVPNTIDHLSLAGTLTIPAGEGPFPAVVVLSDLDTQTRDAVYGDYALTGSLADFLTRRGIAVLRLDDRGIGQSAGDSATVTTADRVRDAQAALSFLRTRPLIDIAHLGMVGHGEGGNIALLAAAQPLAPTFVVALAATGLPGRETLAEQRPSLLLRSGVADTALLGLARRQELARAAARRQAEQLRTSGSNVAQVETFLEQQRMRQKGEDRKRTDALRKRRRAMLEIVRQTADNNQAQAIVANMIQQDNPNMRLDAVHAAASRLTAPWYRSYLNFDPQASLANVRGAVLLMHGTGDDMVEAQTNLDLLAKGLKANKQVTVQKLENINHLFQAPTTEWPLINGQPRPVMAPAALEAMQTWIKARAKD